MKTQLHTQNESIADCNEWISVKQLMPPELRDVLVSTRSGNIITCACFAGDGWFTREGNEWWDSYIAPITHWRWLPESPALPVTEEVTA